MRVDPKNTPPAVKRKGNKEATMKCGNCSRKSTVSDSAAPSKLCKQSRLCSTVILDSLEQLSMFRPHLQRHRPAAVLASVQLHGLLPLGRSDHIDVDAAARHHPFDNPKGLTKREHRADPLPRHRCNLFHPAVGNPRVPSHLVREKLRTYPKFHRLANLDLNDRHVNQTRDLPLWRQYCQSTVDTRVNPNDQSSHKNPLQHMNGCGYNVLALYHHRSQP